MNIPRYGILSAAIAELLGTFFLVFSGICTLLAVRTNFPVACNPYGPMVIGFAFGLLMTSLYLIFQDISGANFNPAVSLGFFINRRIGLITFLIYSAAQLIGAILSVLIAWVSFGPVAKNAGLLGLALPGRPSGTISIFIMELIISIMFVLIFLAASKSLRISLTGSALAIGFSLMVGIMVAGPVSGGSLNPARALAPMLVMGSYPFFFVYLLAPLLGGLIAAIIFGLIFPTPKAPADNEPFPIYSKDSFNIPRP